jgi:hypothetical protein
MKSDYSPITDNSPSRELVQYLVENGERPFSESRLNKAVPESHLIDGYIMEKRLPDGRKVLAAFEDRYGGILTVRIYPANLNQGVGFVAEERLSRGDVSVIDLSPGPEAKRRDEKGLTESYGRDIRFVLDSLKNQS